MLPRNAETANAGKGRSERPVIVKERRLPAFDPEKTPQAHVNKRISKKIGFCGSENLEHRHAACYPPPVPVMSARKPSPSRTADQAAEAMAGYFCRVADTFGLPRSVALIYHALFVAEEPLCFNEIVDQAALSKAGTSTGLKTLERMRAVEQVVVPGSRSTYYRPELSLRRLAGGFLEQSLLPGLEAGGRLLETAPAADDPALPDHLKHRLSSLRTWHETSRELLPMLAALGERDAID